MTIESNMAEWNDASAVYGQILQSYEWGKLKSSFGWTALYVKFDGGMAMVLKRKLPLIRRSFFYIPRGPLINFDSKESINSFISAMKTEAKKHGALFMRVDPEIVEDSFDRIKLLKESGFLKAKKQIQPRCTYILDLSPDIEAINKSFEPKFRYNIKVAQKHDVQVKQVDSIEGVQHFYSVYEETKTRQNFIIHPFNYYKKIFELIISKGLGSIFIAYHQDKPVGGVFIFNFGSRCWYMYGASSNEYRNMMPNNLIHWEVIKWAKSKGLKEYDLWGIPANPLEGHPLWGVYRFKKGFNAKLFKFVGAYDYPFNKVLYKMFDSAIIIYQNLIRLIKKGTISDSLSE